MNRGSIDKFGDSGELCPTHPANKFKIGFTFFQGASGRQRLLVLEAVNIPVNPGPPQRQTPV